MNDSSNNLNPDELDEILEKCSHGENTPVDRARLNELLRDNPERQRKAMAFLFDEAILRHELEAPAVEAITHVKAGQKKRRRIISLATAAIVCIGLSMAAFSFFSRPSAPAVQQAPLAKLIRSNGAEFLGPFDKQDQSFDQGTYKFASGSAEIKFRNGVLSMIEGPARFTIESDMRVVLHEGRIRARVPEQAIGFTIDTPDVEIEDLGTEFGVFVSPDQMTEVHVFSGEVALHAGDSEQPRIVHEGYAANWKDGESPTTLKDPDQNAFPTAETLVREEWLKSREAIVNSKDTLAYFDFLRDEDHPDRLINRSNPFRFEGKIKGATWGQGRSSDSHALLFENPGDRVKIDISGHHLETTLSMWVKVDRLDSSITTLFNTPHYTSKDHHWQIMDNGAMRTAANGVFRVTSKENQIPLGKWIHLVTTYHAESRIARSYVDGVMVIDEQIDSNSPINFCHSNLGFWESPVGWPKERGFRGRIDEFFVQNKAMSPKEIKALYEIGKPLSW